MNNVDNEKHQNMNNVQEDKFLRQPMYHYFESESMSGEGYCADFCILAESRQDRLSRWPP